MNTARGIALQFAFIAGGLLLLILAWQRSTEVTVEVSSPFVFDGGKLTMFPKHLATNTVAAAATLGFSIAGGACLVAAAIVHRAERPRQ